MARGLDRLQATGDDGDMDRKQPLLELSPEELKTWFTDRGLPGYRAGQVRKWIFGRRAAAFDEMTDLPGQCRLLLAEAFDVFTGRVVEHQRADDGAEKLLVELADCERIECVLLRDDRGHSTACISTQVGCAMGCAFCASGLEGLVRNLSRGEILEQTLHLQRLLGPEERLTHVVVMGVGEPLANLDALLPALAAISSPEGLGIGARRITISTVGLPKGIRRLAEDDHPYHLAVSLHAPDDALRNELAPANRAIGIAAVLAAADEYFESTGRRVTFEYVLLAGVNDESEHARRLAQLLRGRPVLVNVIPYNRVSDLPYRTPSPAATAAFVKSLEEAGIAVKVRYRKGDRIEAACGQLRRGGRPKT
jgi:23S rRNA (adenine2503-C2)-methyltransferase